MSFLDYKQYCSSIANKVTGAGKNSDLGNSESELWDSDGDKTDSH
jgi:hypothetical protein